MSRPKRVKMPVGIPYVSLFTGGMGLDLGLEQEGFVPVVCNEIDRGALQTIARNRPQLPVISESITEITKKTLQAAAGQKLADIPLVAGGPPCQAFSVYGKRLGIEDARGTLIFEYIRMVKELRPKTFLMENVRGLHSMSLYSPSAREANPKIPAAHTAHGSLLREIISRFEDLGYRVDCYLVNVVNYGAPQLRERLVCIGNRYNLVSAFPQPAFSNRPADALPTFRTLGDAIGDEFTDPDPTLMDFSPRKLKYLRQIPPGGNWRSLPVALQKESMGKAWFLKGGRSAYWRRLSFDHPCPTVVTMPNHAGTSMCHPESIRALTVGECAAVQEFPRTWEFAGSPAERYRLVGNAVPVRLGRVAGSAIAKLLSDIADRGTRARRGSPIPSAIHHLRPHVRTRTYWKNGKVYAGNTSYYEGTGASAQLGLFEKDGD